MFVVTLHLFSTAYALLLVKNNSTKGDLTHSGVLPSWSIDNICMYKFLNDINFTNFTNFMKDSTFVKF